MIAMIISTWVVTGGWSGIWGLRQNGMNDEFHEGVIESDSGASGYGQAFITVGKSRLTLATEIKT